MKTRFLIILMVFFALMLTSCTEKMDYEEMQEEYSNKTMTTEELKEEAEDLIKEQGLDKEDFEEDSEEESSQGSTMRFCTGTNAGQDYTIYITDDQAYQKAVASNGGISETTIKRYQSCSLLEPSEAPMQCIDISESEYQQLYGGIKQLTEDPMKSMMGFSCNNVEYDESVFILE
jgi:hypothetical protein